MWFSPGDPEAKVNTEPIPPSAMPPYLLPEMEANALTAYILGLNRSNIPPQFLVLRPAEAEPTYNSPVEKGRHVYEKFGCTACHGWDGRGGIRNYNSENDVTPNLRRAVGSYSREELRHKINEGVPIVAKLNPHGPQPPLYMPAWKSKIKGEDLENMITYLQSIREYNAVVPARFWPGP
jgi:mono/diheme cytochrome c family protein